MVITTEDILQHAGVKGMKWGVRKKEYKSNKKQIAQDYKSGKISKAERNTKSLENFHESKSNFSRYKRNYNRRVKKGMNPQKAKVFGQFEDSALKVMNYAQVTAMTVSAIGVGKPIVQAAAKAYMNNPDTIRMGKNIVASLKRSPVRYVDGSTLTNVVNSGMKFQKHLNQPSLRIGHSIDLSDDILKHHGVKGMKWGVIRSKVNKKVSESRVAQELRSVKRTVQVNKTRLNLNDMSTSEIKKANNRLRLENDLKTLTPKLAYTKKGMAQVRKEKKDYRNRSQMSDEEIQRKVDRLRAKSLYGQNANKANANYTKAGKRIVQSAVSVGIKYSKEGGKITVGDILESVVNPSAGNTKDMYELLTKKITK